ncbi:hypothetical protein ACS0TY_018095 [Phlomoides rotata]
MDSTVMAVGQLLPSYISAAHSSSSTGSRISCGSVYVGRIRSGSEVLTSGFCDQSYLQYYGSKFGCSSSMGRMSVISEKHEKRGNDKPLKKMKKKQLKLLKGLTRDLSTFSQIGFGLDSDGALLDQVKGNMISQEATEILLQRLQKIKAEEKELKKKRKEEKARSKAATINQMGVNCEVSSSSSDSSDSECGEIIDMNTLKHSNATVEQSSTYPTPIIPTIPSNEDEKMDLRPSNVDTYSNSQMGPSGFVFPTCSKKIEVCMGGKCRKSGGGALLVEFQKAVGIEGAVSGCKCMGKCKEGPNVRVVNGLDGGEVDIPANSLCIGVGLEDVNMIVANFLGENQCQLAAAATWEF